MRISEYKEIDGEMKLVSRDMTQEEIAEIFVAEEEAEPIDALKEMITEMSTATTLAQMRSAAKSFLDKTE